VYPAAYPNVIGVGGTSLSRIPSGKYQSQAVWSNQDIPEGTGGGPSAYESIPTYQNSLLSIMLLHYGTPVSRGTPDLGAIADPATGVWIYNTPSYGGWRVVGGTSVATPVTAAIFNNLGLFYASTSAALTAIYENTGNLSTNHITPILDGNCGPPGSEEYPLAQGQPYDPTYIYDTTGVTWGYCDGWGSMHG